MLRRRIFSSAMASVMALSSIAVVAQAEETKMVVTEDQLKELVQVELGDTWRADVLCDYGSVSQEAMLDALEAADVILADADADEEDYTVAYMMVKAVFDSLIIHTAEELQALIDECQPIIDTNNIYNEELQDQIYTPDSFGNLEEELDDAKAFVTSTSSSDITEAYEQLAAAKAALSKNPVVSKSMFRNVLKQYDEIIDDQFAYDQWRRGSMNWVDTTGGGYWTNFSNGVSNATFGHYYNYILEVEEEIKSAYDAIDSIKGLTKTTDADIYAGYVTAMDAIAVYGGWVVDDVNKATKAGLSSLINKYHGQLVHEYCATSTEDLLAAIQDAVAADTVLSVAADEVATDANLWYTEGYAEASWNWGAGVQKVVKAEAVIKVTDTSVKAVYVPVTENGYYDDTRDIITDKTLKDDKKYQTISINSKFDIADLIEVKAADCVGGDVTAADNDTLDSSDEWGFSWGSPLASVAAAGAVTGTWDNSVSLEKAMAIAELYINGTKDEIKAGTDILDIDDTGVIAEDPSASSKEYQLAYRYLYYALTEKYEGAIAAGCSHTRADVKTLIADAWDLIEDTGDAAIFNDTNVELVKAREEAMAWVSQANSDKLYKEHQPGTDADEEAYVSSDDAYHALEAAYNALMAEYNALKYSFGEIYEDLAATAEKIDDGDLDATDDLLAAMDAVAYALSTLDPITYTSEGDEYEDNAAFDVDRVFQENNRVITNSGDPQLIAEIDGSVTTKDGANPTHAALVAAYDAMNAAIAAQAEADVVVGDANGDGAVTPADAAAILKFNVGLAEVDEAAADYNGDGAVTPADAAAILKYCVQ